MSNPQKRHWMVTIWPNHVLANVHQDERWTEEDEIDLIELYLEYWENDVRHAPGLVYAVGQIEESPETGQLHIQAYTEWQSSKRRSEISKIIAGHLEYRKGSREDARDYCSKKKWKGKDKGQVMKLPIVGKWRKARKQQVSPKQRVLNLLRLGFAPEEILQKDPEGYFTHFRAIDHMYNQMVRAGISLITEEE